MASDFRKVVSFELIGLVCRLPLFLKPSTYTVAGDVRSPSPLLLSLLLCCCCAAAVVLVWCAVVVSMVVVVLLSRLCEDGALSRTQQARYAVVGVFVILCCG